MVLTDWFSLTIFWLFSPSLRSGEGAGGEDLGFVNNNMNSLPFRLPLWAMAASCFTVMAIALWLPFGLNITDFSDAWVFYGSLDAGLPLLSDSRPFQLVMYHLAYAVDPNSFVGPNLLMLLLFIGKSLAVYGSLRLILPQLPVIAFLSAALLMLFPADTGTFWLAAFNVHSPVFFFFLAVLALVWYWRRPHWLKLLPMGGALVCAELSSAFPRTGGVYVFLRETYSPAVGFLWGWAMFWSVHSGIAAAIATVFARYAG